MYCGRNSAVSGAAVLHGVLGTGWLNERANRRRPSVLTSNIRIAIIPAAAVVVTTVATRSVLCSCQSFNSHFLSDQVASTRHRRRPRRKPAGTCQIQFSVAVFAPYPQNRRESRLVVDQRCPRKRRLRHESTVQVGALRPVLFGRHPSRQRGGLLWGKLPGQWVCSSTLVETKPGG